MHPHRSSVCAGAPSEGGGTGQVFRTLTRNRGPESGPDCLMCAIFDPDCLIYMSYSVLTVLNVPYAGPGCLICAAFGPDCLICA